MKATTLRTLPALAALLLTGCSMSVTSTPSSASSPSTSSVLAFGQARVLDEAELTIAAPQPYTPSAMASGNDQAAAVRLDVTIKNVGDELLDPTTFYLTGTSGSTPATRVFDAPDIGLAPQTSILPGQQVVFPVVLSVADAASLTVEAQPTMLSDSAVWTTTR